MSDIQFVQINISVHLSDNVAFWASHRKLIKVKVTLTQHDQIISMVYLDFQPFLLAGSSLYIIGSILAPITLLEQTG